MPFVLLVFREPEGQIASHSLGPGAFRLGRAPDNEIVIDDASISRHHAVLHVTETVSIEDLESSNGCFVIDRQHAPGDAHGVTARTGLTDWRLPPRVVTPIEPGQAMRTGSVILVVQRAYASAPASRIRSHEYFETRLEDECARAADTRTSFLVLRIAVDEEDPDVERTLGTAVSASEVIARYAPTQYEILTYGEERANEIERALKSALSALGVRCLLSRARFPEDGRSSGALIAATTIREKPRAAPAPTATRTVVLDPILAQLHDLVRRVAVGTIPVLVLGETGVGKEVVVDAVHAASPRANKPLVRLNCAALSETLLESELFGHEKGAFTGATHAKPGLFESAHGGSVFLDEVGELPASMQVKLLRVIEAQSVLRVGSLTPRSIDVRFIAATNRPLEEDVRAGLFREDLYFRLNGVLLVVPPLRERRVEIRPLAELFLSQAASRLDRDRPALSNEAISMLESYDWPGNVRELRNTMERAVLLCQGDQITPEHLARERFRASDSGQIGRNVTLPPPPVGAGAASSPEQLRIALADAERTEVLRALERCGGNQTRAAKLLGISRRTLVTRLAEYRVPRPRK